jgi:tyrosine-protein kinase Etk/Wzc
LKEAGVSAGLQAANVGIVDWAMAPRRPDRPKLWLNLGLAGIVGLMLGVGTGFLREYLDTSVKTPEEVGAFAQGLALGMIPSIRSLHSAQTRLMTPVVQHALLNGNRSRSAPAEADWHRIDGRERDDRGTLSEAFGGLRTSILLNPLSPRMRSLLISSSQPGEGKTTISANLAISLAQLRRKTLLIDADIRRPCLHRLFGVSNQPGLTDVLVEDSGVDGKWKGERMEWRDLLHRSVSTSLDLLTSGGPAANPAELLASPRMSRLVSEALLSYDFVLLDSPPLFTNVADARILAPVVDGTVLVVRSGMTPRDVVRRTLAQCPNIIGIVLNDVNIEELPGCYRVYYGAEPGSVAG